MLARKLGRVFLTDSLKLDDFLKPAHEADAVMYFVSTVEREHVSDLLTGIKWTAFIRNPETATAVSVATRQNIASTDKGLPKLKEGEGLIYVTTDEHDPSELNWYFLVLAFSDTEEEEEDEEDEKVGGHVRCDCPICTRVAKGIKTNIEA
jgi:hypothetical protein